MARVTRQRREAFDARRVRKCVPEWRLDLLPPEARAVLNAPHPPPPSGLPPPRMTWFLCCICGLWRLVNVSNRTRRWTCSYPCRARLTQLRHAQPGPCAMHAISGCATLHRPQSLTCSRTCQLALHAWRVKLRRQSAWQQRLCVICDAVIRRRCPPHKLPRVCSPACRGEYRRWLWLELTVSDVRRKLLGLTPVEAFKFGLSVAQARVKVERKRQERHDWSREQRVAHNARKRALRSERLARAARLDGRTGERPPAPPEQRRPDGVAPGHRLDRPHPDADAAVVRPGAGDPDLHGAE
jgi:hypothetical protein